MVNKVHSSLRTGLYLINLEDSNIKFVKASTAFGIHALPDERGFKEFNIYGLLLYGFIKKEGWPILKMEIELIFPGYQKEVYNFNRLDLHLKYMYLLYTHIIKNFPVLSNICYGVEGDRTLYNIILDLSYFCDIKDIIEFLEFLDI